ncbi:hypothetical protein Tco_1413629, partial [Tanacetum coccineum]
VMAISVISVSLDSSEDSVGTPAGRVILFGTIPTIILDTTPSVIPPTTHIDTTPIPTISPTIPSSPDYTPTSPDYSPVSNTEFDPSKDSSSDHIPPLPATSPFLSLTDDFSDSDMPDTPPLPTHGQPIPHGRPYRYHLNGPVLMMTARKRVGPLPTHRLAVRHSVDYSSSDHFSSDDSLRPRLVRGFFRILVELEFDSIPKRVCHSSSDHSLPTPSSGMISSHHLCSLRSRSPVASVPLSSPTLGALSYARTDLLPSPKRIRSPETSTDLEGCSEDSFEPYVPRETGLGVDFMDESFESSRHRGTYLEINVEVVRSDVIDINPEIQAEIVECFAYTDDLRDRKINVRVVVEAIDREEIKTGVRGPVEDRVDRVTHPVVADDIPEPAQDGAVEVTYETLRDLVQRLHDHTKEIPVHRV